MAWSSPRTWVTGEKVTKALLDAQLRDNLLALANTAGAYQNSNTGPHVIGAASTVDYVRLGLSGAFTSGGASDVAFGTYTIGTLTGHSGDSAAIAGTKLDNNIVTAGSCTTIAQLWLTEPQITVGSGTVTNSVTLYVQGAATEATNDFAGWVDAGVVKIDDQLGIGTSTFSTNAIMAMSGAAVADQPLVTLTNTTSTVNFTQGIHVLTPSAGANHQNGLCVGTEWGSKNGGAVGFYAAGDGTDTNYLYLGLHSQDDVVKVYGNGVVGLKSSVVLNNSQTTGDEGGVIPRLSIWFETASNWGEYIIDSSSASGSKFLLFGLGAGTGSSGIGSVTRNGTTSNVLFNTSSDERIKTSQGVVNSAADVLSALTVHDFTWNDDPSAFLDRGFFAQESNAVTSRGITAGDDHPTTVSETWMMDRSVYVADLVVGWQEHHAAIAALEARVEALENE